MRKCLTCNQPLPDEREYPEYFGKTGIGLAEDEPSDHGDDLGLLLSYSQALFGAICRLASEDVASRAQDGEFLGEYPSEVTERLARLGWELEKEIARRVDGLAHAGWIWQRRAKGEPEDLETLRERLTTQQADRPGKEE